MTPPPSPDTEPTTANKLASDGPSHSAVDIANRLRRAIEAGEYLNNERLAPERELASQFQCSRGTIRSAMQHLEDRGLVSRKMGSGTFVHWQEAADQNEIANTTSPLEMIEVRLCIEPQLAKLAVLNATGRDLDLMLEALEELEQCGEDREKFSEADSRFHRALALSSGNALFVWMYKTINDIRGHNAWNKMKQKVLSVERMAEYNQQHRAIYEAILARDVERAVGVVVGHLEGAKGGLLGVGG